MDELELLKKDWQKKEGQLPKLSYDELYKMTWKKSSSVVKWIFYISIIEFIFWVGVNLIPLSDEKTGFLDDKLSTALILTLEITSYLVLAFFIYKFYRNYRKISVTDSAHDLMKSIITTRKTVMRYVWISLGLFAVSMIVVFIEAVFFNSNYSEVAEQVSQTGNPILMWVFIFLALLVTIAIFVGLLWLFYRLIYGILLKQLKQNYGDLRNLKT